MTHNSTYEIEVCVWVVLQLVLNNFGRKEKYYQNSGDNHERKSYTLFLFFVLIGALELFVTDKIGVVKAVRVKELFPVALSIS